MGSLLTRLTKIFRGSPLYYERIEGVRFGIHQLDFLSLNLPPICNYHCDFCFIPRASENPTHHTEIHKNSLTMDEYTSLIRDARALGVCHIEISGEGEPDLPLFRPILTHIIRTATVLGIHTTVFVNGSWLDENLLHFLKDTDSSVAVSIKYTDPEKYNRSVGIRDAYRHVERNLETARLALGGYAELKGCHVYRLAINSTILKNNEEDNLRLRRYCEERDIFFHASTLIPRGKTEGATIDRARQDALSRELSISSIITAASSRDSLGFPVCGTFYYGLGINYDGQVLFDAHADDSLGIIGNVREIGLTEAVRRQQALRDAFYHEGGISYCPLRDIRYPNFINQYGKETQ